MTDVVTEHKQSLHGDATVGEESAQVGDGGFAVGLLLVVHLAAAGTGDMDDEDLGGKPRGEVGDGRSQFFGRQRAAYRDQNPAHEGTISEGGKGSRVWGTEVLLHQGDHFAHGFAAAIAGRDHMSAVGDRKTRQAVLDFLTR